jgi:outer membrane protein TolC
VPAFLACIGLSYPAYVSASEPVQTSSPPPRPVTQAAGALGLADLERIALQRNPTLAQAAAHIEISRAKALQAGLHLNPTVGYVSDQIGGAGTAGDGGLSLWISRLQQCPIRASYPRKNAPAFRVRPEWRH